MSVCGFCGLPSVSLFSIYDVEVCLDCTDLAEVAYAGDEESDYIDNMAFDLYHDR